MLGEQSGVSKSAGGTGPTTQSIGGRNAYQGGDNRGFFHLGDTGTAARFFYCAKSARGERDAGLEGFAVQDEATMGDGWEKQDGKAGRKRHGALVAHNPHPCVKPLDLCRYYATLIRPPESYLDDAVLFVPFCGTGSEIIGAILAGWRNIVGVEVDADTCDIARARIAWWQRAYNETGLSDPKAILKVMKKRKPAPLLELAEAAS